MASHPQIPFNRAHTSGNELLYIERAIHTARLSGDGPFTQKSSQLIQEILGCRKVLLTTSCTHALEMAALLLPIAPGDEVIVPSFTFVSTVNAFVLRGAKPIFADCTADTLNMDPEHVASLISKKTKAIVPVHYAGVGCDMQKLISLADSHQLTIIEDNAHGLFGKYNNQWLGTFGRLATLSFHETKNIVAGEGGALLINDESLIERAEILREKGTNRSRFFRGQVDKYTWVDLGSSYLPSELIAAFLCAQLESWQQIQSRRKEIWDTYHKEIANWAAQNGIKQPTVPQNTDQAYHMYYLLLPSLAERQRFISHLKDHGIMAVFHYLPLHSSPMGLSHGGKLGDCPVTESISDRLVRLPFYFGLDQEKQRIVIDAILAFKC